MKKTKFLLFILLILTFYSFNSFAEGQFEKTDRLKLATTTSTENTGLLDTLLPAFTEKTGIEVDTIAVGTGKAIALGENGDVDVIMVHARTKEDIFISEGYGVNRRDLMHNDFIIIGPSNDPASIRESAEKSNNPVLAFEKISRSGSDFISRGDESGTHCKEKELWAETGFTPTGEWYKESGRGMGAVIVMSNDLAAYTLTDRGTFIAMKDKIDLEILVQGDSRLFNPYGIIAVNPKKHENINYEGAMKLIAFLTSNTGQGIIENFKIDGEQLFYPDAIR